MASLINIIIILIATGIAADNLMIAAICGNGLASFSIFKYKIKNHKWVLLLLFVFIVEYQVLQCGSWCSDLTQKSIKGIGEWVASGILLAIGVTMLFELKTKNRVSLYLSLDVKSFLHLVLGTSVYVFSFSFCMHLLNINERNEQLTILPLLIVFLIGGLFLGKYHFDKTLRWINPVAALMVLAGGIILMVQKIISIT